MLNEVEALFKGKHEQEGITGEMKAYLKVFKRNDNGSTDYGIEDAVSQAEYQGAFKAAKEKTSSNGTNGLNYTIWKALAERDEVTDYICVMMSLPFVYGFVNRRWVKMIDVMLEKKRGIRHIHMLQIIGLLEADFNTALKIFARRLMQRSEEHGLSSK